MKQKKLVEFRYVKDIAQNIIYVQFKRTFKWQYGFERNEAGKNIQSFKNKDKAMAWILKQYDLKYEAMTLLQYPSLKIV